MYLTKQQAEIFYSVHKERPFFNSLVEYMTSGPVQVQVLEGNDAVSITAKSWGPLTLLMLKREPLESYMQSLLKLILFMVVTLMKCKIEIEFFFLVQS